MTDIKQPLDPYNLPFRFDRKSTSLTLDGFIYDVWRFAEVRGNIIFKFLICIKKPTDIKNRTIVL